MNMLLCQLFWIDVFPNLWWGLVIAVVFIWSLYIVSPLIKGYIDSKSTILDMQQKHEEKMKTDAFEREKQWYFIKKTGLPLDELEKELKDNKEKLDKLQKQQEELEKGTEALNKEKEEFEKKILNTKIQVYEEIIKSFNK